MAWPGSRARSAAPSSSPWGAASAGGGPHVELLARIRRECPFEPEAHALDVSRRSPCGQRADLDRRVRSGVVDGCCVGVRVDLRRLVRDREVGAVEGRRRECARVHAEDGVTAQRNLARPALQGDQRVQRLEDGRVAKRLFLLLDKHHLGEQRRDALAGGRRHLLPTIARVTSRASFGSASATVRASARIWPSSTVGRRTSSTGRIWGDTESSIRMDPPWRWTEV
jgi:hypothetical protein